MIDRREGCYLATLSFVGSVWNLTCNHSTINDMTILYNNIEARCREDLEPASTSIGRLLDELAGVVFERIRPHFPNEPQPGKVGTYKKHIGFVVMNLLRGYSMLSNMRVGIPTSTNAFTKKTTLWKRGYTHRIMKAVMGGMEAEGLVEALGSRAQSTNPFKGEFKRTANSWWATEELVVLVDSVGLIPEMFKTAKRAEEVRDEFKKHIPQGKYTSAKAKSDAKLRKINTLLQLTPVTFDMERMKAEVDEKKIQWKSYDRTKSTLYRVFNGTKDKGGRFFGHWVEYLKKEYRRKYLLIGGQPTAELDFQSFNISLLHALEGLEIGQDPYTLENSPVTRGVVKVLVNAALNSQDKQEAVGAIYGQTREGWILDRHGRKYPLRSAKSYTHTQLEEALDEALDRLPPQLMKYFFTEFGFTAMNYESEIAFKVLEGMTAQGLPTIPIHDGFVCQDSSAGILKQEMERASEEVLGRPIGVDRK